MILISTTITLALLIVTILSCVSDVRSLRIPNWHSLAILGGFFVAYFSAPELFNGLGRHLIAMTAMFVVTYIMFTYGVIGGGDAKFGTALGLWVGLKGIVPFIFYMTMIGGILGLAALLLRKRKLFKNPRPGSWVEQAQTGHSAVPYGVAISLGFWMELIHAGFVQTEAGAVLKFIHAL